MINKSEILNLLQLKKETDAVNLLDFFTTDELVGFKDEVISVAKQYSQQKFLAVFVPKVEPQSSKEDLSKQFSRLKVEKKVEDEAHQAKADTAVAPVLWQKPAANDKDGERKVHAETGTIDVIQFIDQQIQEHQKNNHGTGCLEECNCEKLKRNPEHFGEASPRNDMDDLVIKWLTKKYPVAYHKTLNLVFVGEGKMKPSAVLIGKLNQLGYSVNVSIIDPHYVTLSQTYNSTLKVFIAKNQLLQPQDIERVNQLFEDYKRSYTTTFGQYEFVLKALSAKYKVQNTIQGSFYATTAFDAVVANKRTVFGKSMRTMKESNKSPQSTFNKYLEGKLKQDEKQRLLDALKLNKDEHFLHLVSFEDCEKLMPKFQENKTIHGLFVLDLSASEEVVREVIQSIPTALQQTAFVFTSFEDETFKAYDRQNKNSKITVFSNDDYNKKLVEEESSIYHFDSASGPRMGWKVVKLSKEEIDKVRERQSQASVRYY